MSDIENPELRARAAARKLKDKDNLSLAEKLILASSQETMQYSYKGVDIEVYVPTQAEHDKLTGSFQQYIKDASDGEGTKGGALDELYEMVAGFCVDDSITPEVLKSGQLGASFLPKFVNEIMEHEKRVVQEVTAVKGFRRK